MFGIDFYPTPPEVIEAITRGENLEGVNILEPSAGSGNVVQFCKDRGAQVIACEIDENLRAILERKCTVIAADCMELQAEQISHIKLIIMNPPFSKQEQHILHLWNIAPPGCKIISLCNASLIENSRYRSKNEEIAAIIRNNGSGENIGDAFKNADRPTGIDIGLIKIQKPSSDYNTEFAGFYMDDEGEEETGPGLMPYNLIRDIVGRYIEAVKIFDEQLETAARLNNTLSLFHGMKYGFTVTAENKPYQRTEFKKDLQRSAWKHIIEKFDLKKYATKNLKEDINKFIEDQYLVPFTMKNIYVMLHTIVATRGQQMNKAIIEIFEKLTAHHEDNRQGLEGWKTNSHYILTQKFILPYIAESDYSGNAKLRSYNGNYQIIEDLEKVLCWMNNIDHNEIKDSFNIKRFDWGQWNDESHFFKIKLFKKGTGHFEFKDEDIWAKFNAAVGRIKGFPLYEAKKQTAYQDRQTGKTSARPQQTATKEAQILFEFNL